MDVAKFVKNFNKAFSDPFLPNGFARAEVHDDKDGFTLTIGRRDVHFDPDGKVLGAGTFMASPWTIIKDE